MTPIELVLLGSTVAAISGYILMVLLLTIKAAKGELESNDCGIKNLKFQDYNPTWQKYVVPMIR